MTDVLPMPRRNCLNLKACVVLMHLGGVICGRADVLCSPTGLPLCVVMMLHNVQSNLGLRP